MLALLPQIVFGSNNWQVVDTTGTEEPGDEAYICLVTPKMTPSYISINDIMVMHRRGDKYPMVMFAGTDQGAYNFKYIIDHPNTPEKVQEILPDRKGRLGITGKQAVKFIQQLKKGNQIRYLISSSKRENETQAISLIGFTKVYNSINDCKE